MAVFKDPELNEAGEELQLASQADLVDQEENDQLYEFQQLLVSLENVDGVSEKAEIVNYASSQLDDAPKDSVELRKNIMQMSLMVEEAAQLYYLRSHAMKKSQLSMCLSSTSIADE